MNFNKRQHYVPYQRRRGRRRNFMPLIIFLVVIFLVIFLGVKLVKLIFSSGRSESAAAELQVSQGRAEFYFPDKKEWTPAYSDQKFLEGDRIRTTNNSQGSLSFFNNNKIFLDQNSEISFTKFSGDMQGDKEVSFKLAQGHIWANISDKDFGNQNSTFDLETPRAILHVRGTIFDIDSTERSDTIRLIKGNIDVDIFGTKKDRLTNIKVGVGQKLTITATTADDIKSGKDVLEMIDSDFLHSGWNIKNISEFDPQTSAALQKERDAQKQKEEADTSAQTDFPTPQITDPAEGTVVSATQDSITISGTTTEDTMQIIVNGYTLTKFQPGDKQWSYFASYNFGTMISGDNTFEVIAVSRDGKKSKPAVLHITYQGGESSGSIAPSSNTRSTTETTGMIQTSEKKKTITNSSQISDLTQPTIVRPEIANLEDPYQTSANVVTITGVPDPRTERIEVNGFELKKFKPGDTEFKYIANAQPGYENMKPGLNTYEIVTYGPNGTSASVILKILYSPFTIKQR